MLKCHLWFGGTLVWWKQYNSFSIYEEVEGEGVLLLSPFPPFVQIPLPDSPWHMQSVTSPMSPMNSLFKTIFWVKLSFWLDMSFLLRLLNSKQVEQNLHNVTDKWLFQDDLPSKTIVLTLQALSPERLNKEHTVASIVSLMNGLFKTILWVNLSYWLNEMCLPGVLTMKFPQC